MCAAGGYFGFAGSMNRRSLVDGGGGPRAMGEEQRLAMVYSDSKCYFGSSGRRSWKHWVQLAKEGREVGSRDGMGLAKTCLFGDEMRDARCEMRGARKGFVMKGDILLIWTAFE